MELMSYLLLCAVVAFLPQAHGRSSIKVSYNSDFNNTILVKKRPLMGKNILLNINSSPLHSKVSDLQSVFMDPACRGCYLCMERSIKAHKVHNKTIGTHDYIENLQEEFSIQDKTRRDKRKANVNKVASKHQKKTKRSKSKKNNKAVTIIKFNDSDKVYALKIKETHTNILDHNNTTKIVSTCQVFSVQKSFPCESHEADLILRASKNKINEKVKKEQSKHESNVSEDKDILMAPAFRKRQIDNTQVPEHIMPSVEEMY